MKQNLIIITALILLQLNDVSAQTTPTIISFNLSECKENCYIKADLITQSKTNDTLFIEAGINLNCCGNFHGNFEYRTSDTLDLIIMNHPDENGNLVSCNCNCYYVINYEILNADSLPKIILINGETFEENRKRAGWQEIGLPRIQNK